MLCLACTGGIGSGKSFVVKILTTMGFPAYIADERTKLLYQTNPYLLKELATLLGDDIIENGKLQKKIMAQKIFADKTLLEKVNAIVHPVVFEDFTKWKQLMAKEGHWLVILESAIMLESALFKNSADKLAVIDAPEDIKIERVMKRDGVSESMVRERMEMQMSSADMRAFADYIIFADGKQALLPQIMNILKDLKSNIQ